jgi:SAM-dependent methyltransferase
MNMNSYSGFASVYDVLMSDVPYREWLDFIEERFRENQREIHTVLDLACGTGTVSLMLHERGYDVTGIDRSPDMLAVAAEKSRDILWLNQDMAAFELYGTVDAIVCLCDSLNYVTARSDFTRLFRLAENYLEFGGLFIFDVATRRRFERVIAGGTFCGKSEDAAYIMESSYDRKRHINEYRTTFFAKAENGLYSRFEERHVQRAHSREEIEQAIAAAGLTLLSVYDGGSFAPANEDSGRAFYVCRKRLAV